MTIVTHKNLHSPPNVVKQSEMPRYWWIHYKWELLIGVDTFEPEYILCGIRPIEDAQSAANQFDSWLACKSDAVI